jgi:aryl-alcohol dehydrogenase-like predicted oxidoreductase
MDYPTSGRSGLRVSRVYLGGMMFGGATDEPTAARIVAPAHDQGVNFIVGRAIRDHRS